MSSDNTWFVTGTDTDAGKTSVAQALLLAARARGLRATGYKPVESGCPISQEVGNDALAMAKASGQSPQTSYVFRAPVAPLHAAQQAGETISISRIQARTAELRQQSELLLVEGAGGLLVPLSPETTIADLALALGHPLLIVAPDALGSINHSLLTIEDARRRGLQVDALILSERHMGGGEGLANADQIRDYGEVEVLSLPHATSREALARGGENLLTALLKIAAAKSSNN